MIQLKDNPKEWQALSDDKPGRTPIVRKRSLTEGILLHTSYNTAVDLTESEAVHLTAWLIRHGYNRA